MKPSNLIKLSAVLFSISLAGLVSCTEYEELTDTEIAVERTAESRAN